MTRKNLNKIRNLRELEVAHLEVLNDLSRSKNAMRKDVRHIEKLFKPANLFNSGWRIMAPTTPTPGQLLLGAVRRLKAHLQSK